LSRDDKRRKGPWVRVRLSGGRSGAEAWEADAAAAGARIVVGSARGCAWQVEAPGVLPQHLELFWDGEVLWVAGMATAAGLRVDGQLVDDWYATAQGSRVELGSALLTVECTQALGGERASIPSRDDVTGVEGGIRSLPGESSLLGAPTEIAPEGAPFFSEPNQAPPDQFVPEGMAPPIADRSTMPTRSGSGSEPVFGGAAAGGSLGLATRLVETPEAAGIAARQGAPPGRPPPPRIGNKTQGVARASDPSVSALPPTAAMPAVAPAIIPAPHLGGTPPSHAGIIPAPQVAAPPVQMAAPAPAPTPDGAPQPGPFAAPPPVDAGTVGAKKEMSLPPRTWILLGITVVALAGFILMDDEVPEEDPVTPPTPAAHGSAVDDASTPDAGPEEPGSDDAGAEPETPDAGPAARDAGRTRNTGRHRNEPPELTLERKAADAYVAGNLREALNLYRQLAREHPDRDAFAAITGILERRIQEICRDGVDSRGQPCESD